MTVIVGIEAGEEHEAVVIATDRCCVEGFDIIDLIYDHSYGLDRRKLKKELSNIGEGIKYHLKTKIQCSKDKKVLLTYTGMENDETRLVSEYLLNPQAFLERTEIVKKIISPIIKDGNLIDPLVKFYREMFPITEDAVDPTIQMLNFLRAVGDKSVTEDKLARFIQAPFLPIPEDFYDQYSLFLLGRVERADETQWARLYELTRAGHLKDEPLFTNGSGGDIAMKYIKDNFPYNIFLNRVSLKRIPSIEEAVSLATGAVKKACDEDVFCKGLNYAILSANGLEVYLDENQESGYISYEEIFEDRLKRIKSAERNYRKIINSLPKK